MKPRFVQSMILSWVSMIATDFLLHAGILARLYTRESPFLLSAKEAFIRIPLGYLSFVFLTVLLGYIFHLKMPENTVSGLKEGLKIGFVVWLSFGLGLYSLSTIGMDLTIGWVVGQTVEMGVGGYFLVLGMKTKKLSRAWKRLVLYAIIIIIVVMVLQVSGMAPPMETID